MSDPVFHVHDTRLHMEEDDRRHPHASITLPSPFIQRVLTDDPDVREVIMKSCHKQPEPMMLTAVITGFRQKLVEDAYHAFISSSRFVGHSVAALVFLLVALFRIFRVLSGTNVHPIDEAWVLATVAFFAMGACSAVVLFCFRNPVQQRFLLHLTMRIIALCLAITTGLFSMECIHGQDKDAVENGLWASLVSVATPLGMMTFLKVSYLECCVYSLVFGLIIGSSSHMSVTRAVVMGVFYFLLVNALLFHMAYSQRAAFMAQLECMHLQAQAHENETRQQFVEHDQKIMQEQVERLKIQAQSVFSLLLLLITMHNV